MIFVGIFWLFLAVFMFGIGNSVSKSVDRGGTVFYILGVVPSVFTLICNTITFSSFLHRKVTLD